MKYREVLMIEALEAMRRGEHVEGECSGYGWRKTIIINKWCYERVVWNDCQDVTIPIYLNRKWRICEEEQEWEEWERSKAHRSSIRFERGVGTYGTVVWQQCLGYTERFGGFVFRRDGRTDLVNFGSPVMGLHKKTGELHAIWDVGFIEDYKIVYADAVRMRREGE